MSDITLMVDGEAVAVRAGSTVLDATRRVGRDVPTLCHDDRVDPMGSCRMCLVEIEGQRRLQPSCAFEASNGMVVSTNSARVKQHRQLLLSMYMADHALDADGLPVERGVGNRLRTQVQTHGHG
ncbi:MAG: NADH dehydrogenase/NADH:ubiquinone oxidoreductase subunit G, partial [Myxococcota bacterium]